MFLTAGMTKPTAQAVKGKPYTKLIGPEDETAVNASDEWENMMTYNFFTPPFFLTTGIVLFHNTGIQSCKAQVHS